VVFTVSSVAVVAFAVRYVTEPFDASNEYLALLRAGDYREAFASQCPGVRDHQPPFFFLQHERKLSNERGRITGYDIDDWSQPAHEDEGFIDRVTEGTVTRGGRTYDVSIFLARDGGEWRVCQMDERRQTGPPGPSLGG
jgi:hypothetical protein